MARTEHILLLAGTYEARLLARDLGQNFPNARLTASFAGAVSDLPNLGVPTRVGGFGGVEGLCAYLQNEGVTMLLDATHPFAAQMSRNAALAAQKSDVPLIRLERPPWRKQEGDCWQMASDLHAAANLLPAGSRVFLSIGRNDISLFTHRTDLTGIARMIEPPATPLPAHWHLILSRPAQSVAEEIALFQTYEITHLATKNSGGSRAYAKIEAARALDLPVVMVDRPILPEARVAQSVEKVLELLKGY